MKVALLTPTFSHFSGIDRLVEIKSREFAKKGDKVDIFALKATIKPKGAICYTLGMPKNALFERIYRLCMWMDLPKINKYSKKLAGYDMVVSFQYPMNLLACRAKKINKRLKYVYHNAGVGIEDSYSIAEKIYLKIFLFFTNMTLMNVDQVVSISNFLREELKKQTGIDSKVEYIPIDKERFCKGVSGLSTRKKLNIGSEPFLLYVGRLSPHKGIHLLIDSFKIVQKTYPKAKLVIVGKHTFSSYSKKLRKMASGNVIFKGFVADKDLSAYYSACDVYTTASLWEGFDMPVAEANFMGKPVVAFDAGSHKEVLKKGILVPKGDVKKFAEAIIEILRRT